MKSWLAVLLFLPLLASQCNRRPAAAKMPFVQLETGACFGFCPIFRLTVRNNGWTEYEGKRFAVKAGLDSFQLTTAELTLLREKVKSVDLWQYPERIETQTADAPYGTLTVWAEGRTKSVTGTIDRPAPLLELEEMLKDLATAHGLDVRTGVDPNRPPATVDKKEILVKLKPEVNAGNFMMQFTELNLDLVRRTGEENIWVVAYDPTQISEQALIDLFKGMDGVLEAQTNGTAGKRN